MLLKKSRIPFEWISQFWIIFFGAKLAPKFWSIATMTSLESDLLAKLPRFHWLVAGTMRCWILTWLEKESRQKDPSISLYLRSFSLSCMYLRSFSLGCLRYVLYINYTDSKELSHSCLQPIPVSHKKLWSWPEQVSNLLRITQVNFAQALPKSFVINLLRRPDSKYLKNVTPKVVLFQANLGQYT